MRLCHVGLVPEVSGLSTERINSPLEGAEILSLGFRKSPVDGGSFAVMTEI